MVYYVVHTLIIQWASNTWVMLSLQCKVDCFIIHLSVLSSGLDRQMNDKAPNSIGRLLVSLSSISQL